MKDYFVIVILITHLNANSITNYLLKKNYIISTAGNGTIPDENDNNGDAPTATMVFRAISPTNTTVENMRVLVGDLLDELKINHFGVFVLPSTASLAWRRSNISLSQAKKARTVKITKASHLQLIKPVEEKSTHSENKDV